jgi:hypothetical protein
MYKVVPGQRRHRRINGLSLRADERPGAAYMKDFVAELVVGSGYTPAWGFSLKVDLGSRAQAPGRPHRPPPDRWPEAVEAPTGQNQVNLAHLPGRTTHVQAGDQVQDADARPGSGKAVTARAWCHNPFRCRIAGWLSVDVSIALDAFVKAGYEEVLRAQTHIGFVGGVLLEA